MNDQERGNVYNAVDLLKKSRERREALVVTLRWLGTKHHSIGIVRGDSSIIKFALYLSEMILLDTARVQDLLEPLDKRDDLPF